MRKARKVLAVLMAVSILCSVLALASSALTYSPSYNSGAFKLIANADKTTVAAGDVVEISMSIDGGTTYTDGFSNFGNVIIYNNTQLTPCDSTGTPSTAAGAFRNWSNDCINWASPTATVNAGYAITQLSSFLTADEQAYYNKTVLFSANPDTANGITNADRWSATAGAYVTMYFKVADTVSPGDEIWVGMHQAAFEKKSAYFYYNGVRQQDLSIYDFTNSMVKLTVASAATMEVNPITNANSGYGQIRFQGTDPAANHDFDIRIGSTITNVNEVYADEAAFAADIVDIGFIFSASAMSAADAATVAEGGSVSGITKKSLDDQYLQRITSGESYKFFCFITDIPYADVADTLYAYAYVQTSANGYFYYPAVISIAYSDLYNAYVADYNAWLANP